MMGSDDVYPEVEELVDRWLRKAGLTSEGIKGMDSMLRAYTANLVRSKMRDAASDGFVKGLGVAASLARGEARQHAAALEDEDEFHACYAEEYARQCCEDLAERIRNAPAPGHPRPDKETP